MLAVDNVLRRRFLLGVNRNALMRASNNFELLLYAAARETWTGWAAGARTTRTCT